MPKPVDIDTAHVLLRQPTAEQKQAVEDVVVKYVQLASDKANTPFAMPAIEYNLSGTTAGYANSTRIKLNYELLLQNWDDMLEHTIPHEVAHVVQSQLWPYSKPHGHEWQRVMYWFGLPPTRCHAYDTEKSRIHPRPHIYQCGCKQWRITNLIHKRIQRGSSRYCPSCGIYLQYVWTIEE